MTVLSWIDVRAPIRIGITSPRTTVPYQMLDSSPITTSPITAAVSAMNTPLPRLGRLPAWPRSMFLLLDAGEHFIERSVDVVGVRRDRRDATHDAARVDDQEVNAIGLEELGVEQRVLRRDRERHARAEHL